MNDTSLDATALAELVRTGQASPSELVDEAITRIERHNPTVNAVIHERFEKARAEAKGELPDGPFRGVPLLVKDLGCAMAGEPMHMGCAGLQRIDFRTPGDSFLYESFRDAGFVTLGRTNTPEFGTTITTEPVSHGISRNPWNTDHSTGGSSGGSAAAVAAGMVPMAHASDGGGSIRVPASECGLFGLKPSRGRISKGPAVGDSWAGASTDGVVSRSVRDTAAALDVMSGRRTGDPYAAAQPTRPFADEVGADVGALRIGLAPTHANVDTDADCVASVEAAGALLTDLGHTVEVAQPPAFGTDELSQYFITIIAASLAADLAALGALTGHEFTADDLEPDNWFMAEIGRSVTAADYLNAVAFVHAWSRQIHAWWDDFDILVSPVIAVPPPPIGWLRDPEQGTERLTSILQFTPQFNMTGQPAMSMPLHWTDDGLPVGVQFAGAIDDEAGLLRLAAQIEQAAPWAHRTAPIFG